MTKGDATPLFYSNAEKYGWEVSGDYNTNYKHTSWLEGAWMSKYKGKYYLQYAVPGTEFKSYSNGGYVSEHPLGPCALLRHKPDTFLFVVFVFVFVFVWFFFFFFMVGRVCAVFRSV